MDRAAETIREPEREAQVRAIERSGSYRLAHVVSLITGAAQAGGFKGIGGRFDRRNLLAFNTAIGADVRFQRIDTGAAVEAAYRPEHVSPDSRMHALMPRVASGSASAEEQREFRVLWQERVRRILIDHFDSPALVALAAL